VNACSVQAMEPGLKTNQMKEASMHGCLGITLAPNSSSVSSYFHKSLGHQFKSHLIYKNSRKFELLLSIIRFTICFFSFSFFGLEI
jgi:hypothetical protein